MEFTTISIITYILSIVISSVVTAVILKIQNRTKSLYYSVTHNRIGFSADDKVFGKVEILYNGNPVPNLFLSTATVVNKTGTDLTNVVLKTYSSASCRYIADRAGIVDSPYPVRWDDSFSKALAVAEGEKPTEQQFALFNHEREHIIPVLNRNMRVEIQILLTCNEKDPYVFVSTMIPGVSVKHKPAPQEFMGTPLFEVLVKSTIICLATCFLITYYLDNKYVIASLVLLVSVLACVFAAGLAWLQRRLSKFLFG